MSDGEHGPHGPFPIESPILAASRREVAALKEALRKVAIRHRGSIWNDHAALPAMGCELCDHRWITGMQAEDHAESCLAALVEGTTAGERTP